VKKTKLILFLFIVAIVAIFYATGTFKYLELNYIQKNLNSIRAYYVTNPVTMISLFLVAYIGITSMSIPGAIVLTLLAGAIFGITFGTFLVCLASTAGATISFLMSRYLFREAMLKKFHHQLQNVNQKMKEKGSSYLFTIRMIPVSPYVVINVLMGLTHIRTWTYIWITFVAMLPGNLVYVYAGRKIAEINSPSEILSWPIILMLTFIGVAPWIISKFLKGDEYEYQR
jgi:uncharacterized membrane protein YdjX (TVP38/TMEM64 family)